MQLATQFIRERSREDLNDSGRNYMKLFGVLDTRVYCCRKQPEWSYETDAIIDCTFENLNFDGDEREKVRWTKVPGIGTTERIHPTQCRSTAGTIC